MKRGLYSDDGSNDDEAHACPSYEIEIDDVSLGYITETAFLSKTDSMKLLMLDSGCTRTLVPDLSMIDRSTIKKVRYVISAAKKSARMVSNKSETLKFWYNGKRQSIENVLVVEEFAGYLLSVSDMAVSGWDVRFTVPTKLAPSLGIITNEKQPEKSMVTTPGVGHEKLYYLCAFKTKDLSLVQ